MITTQTDYEKLFKLFVGTDEMRTDMQTPFKQDGKYFATDAYSIIYIPIDKVELSYPEQDRPKASAVIVKETNCNIGIKIADIDRQLVPTIIDETIGEETEKECKNCDGDGVVECDMEHEHDCPDCYGGGKIITEIQKPTGKKIPMGHKLFRMDGVGFQYTQLRRLIDACNLMGVETITKVFGTSSRGNIFECGEAKIMVMPAIISGEESPEFKPTEINV